MRAIILAAGVGSRLFGDNGDQPPKSLLELGGRTLLARHLETLAALGVGPVTVVVGYRAPEVEAEARRAGGANVRTVLNMRFREGSLVSLWTAAETLRAGEPVLFMDADVLYDRRMIERLVIAPGGSCFLFDSAVGADDDPVLICLRGGRIAEFGKLKRGAFDRVGEWPGFLRLDAAAARALADALARFMEAGRTAEPYEAAMREVVLAAPERFAIEDISGIPWVEIDFPADLARAREQVLPAL